MIKNGLGRRELQRDIYERDISGKIDRDYSGTPFPINPLHSENGDLNPPFFIGTVEKAAM